MRIESRVVENGSSSGDTGRQAALQSQDRLEATAEGRAGGEGRELPLPYFSRRSDPRRMKQLSITRRVFLAAAGAAGLTTVVGCGGGGGGDPTGGGTQYVAYRLSTKGKRASNAAKANAANKLFVSAQAADLGRAHPGDTSAVVRIDLSEARWMQLFGSGLDAVDLRRA